MASPIEHLTTSELPHVHPSICVSEQQKNPPSTEVQALKLRIIWSGLFPMQVLVLDVWERLNLLRSWHSRSSISIHQDFLEHGAE